MPRFFPASSLSTGSVPAPTTPSAFAAGEPFATLLLYPKGAPKNLTLEVVQPESEADPDACELALEELADSAAVHRIFQRLRVAALMPTPKKPSDPIAQMPVNGLTGLPGQTEVKVLSPSGQQPVFRR